MLSVTSKDTEVPQVLEKLMEKWEILRSQKTLTTGEKEEFEKNSRNIEGFYFTKPQ